MLLRCFGAAFRSALDVPLRMAVARWNEEMDERSARRNQETGCHMALCGLSGSKPRIRAARSKIAPPQRPDTLMQLSRSSILEVHLVPHGRAIHSGTSGLAHLYSAL